MSRFPDTWTLPQRRVLIGIGVALVAYVTILAVVHPLTVTDPQPIEPAHARDLADRIDPNVADVATLAALPTIGEKRAQDIVEFRERVKLRDGVSVVFVTPHDLLKIRGVGPAMLSTIEPYLIFPAGAPATRPGL